MLRPLTRPASTALLAAFVLLAIVHTWPLARHPGTLSRNDNGDTVLNEWTLSWVGRQIFRDPVHLFDANIFYPERGTLAYSEPLLVPSVMGLPLTAAGAAPVLVYNLLLMAGFALSGWAWAVLVWRWTGDPVAAVVSGIIAAFNAHTFSRLPHLQALHTEFLPLALLALDRLLTRPSSGAALMLAAGFVLQGLTSVYLLVFTTVALIVSGVVRVEDWRGPQARRLAPFVLGAAAIGVVALTPFLLQFRAVGVIRTLEDTRRYAAAWTDYLSTPARIHYQAWSRYVFGRTALFPGIIAILGSAVALCSGVAWRDRRARSALAFGMAGLALSFGPALPGYGLLYRVLPIMQGVRGAARFGFLTIAAMAVLTGFGVAHLRRLWSGPGATLAAALLLVAVNADAWVAPIGYVPPDRVPTLYTIVRNRSDAVVLELPFFPPDRAIHNADYMLAAAFHSRPILNGYSGLVPASYVAHYEALKGFPDDSAIAMLAREHVTHVVMHYAEMRRWNGDAMLQASRHSPRLRLVAQDEAAGVYEIVP